MKGIQNTIHGLFAGLFGISFLLSVYTGCKNDPPATDGDLPSPVTPVSVTTIVDSTMTDDVELAAVSAYLEKSLVKANINGYVKSADIKTGAQVKSGQLLFALVTKEARSIANTINELDPGLRFSGVSSIRAEAPGIVVQVNHQKGDYVQDGETLATISNRNSLVFLLDLPYELHQVIAANRHPEIILPDGTKLPGTVSGTMPAVDSLAQTQKYIIRVNTHERIPEGLIGKVRLIKLSHPGAQVLPKTAVLANETEDQFWIMKLINDSTAVKIVVKRGIENGNSIEILAPRLKRTDRIITTGNYGLADTAKIRIQK